MSIASYHLENGGHRFRESFLQLNFKPSYSDCRREIMLGKVADGSPLNAATELSRTGGVRQ
jgi:hypothetical protein